MVPGLVVLRGEKSIGVVLEIKGTGVTVLETATGVLFDVMSEDDAVVLEATAF